MVKNSAKKVTVDERGRITLPSEIREGAESFLIEKKKDGTISLVPQKTVSAGEADLLANLKRSVSQMKKGKTEPMPDEWIEK
jgi:AbrB family looped-hinge helix DNA binding protein